MPTRRRWQNQRIDEVIYFRRTPRLSGQVYSSSALELFWNIDDLGNANTLGFEVFQNGQSVNESNSPSYFVDALSASTSYRFELVSRNAQGDEVARSDELTLTTR